MTQRHWHRLLAPMRARRRAIASLLLLLYLPACMGWHVETAAPEHLVREQEPQQIRLSPPEGQGYCLTNDGVYQAAFVCQQEHLVMRSPTVAGDSLVGLIEGNESLVALEEIDQVATRTFSPLRTLTRLAVIALFLWGYCAVVSEVKCSNA